VHVMVALRPIHQRGGEHAGGGQGRTGRCRSCSARPEATSVLHRRSVARSWTMWGHVQVMNKANSVCGLAEQGNNLFPPDLNCWC
jgi:hypothetical protein